MPIRAVTGAPHKYQPIQKYKNSKNLGQIRKNQNKPISALTSEITRLSKELEGATIE